MSQSSVFEYNIYEERLLKVLLFAFRPLSTTQISKFSGIGYSTTVTYLNQLRQKSKLKYVKNGNKILWEIR